MRVLSVNVGFPRAMRWEGRSFESAIAKDPVARRVAVRTRNLDGDAQADLKNHGGLYKAVYAYPFEHYPFWQRLLGQTLPMGALGENLTLEGLDESTVCSGDRLHVGTAEFVVTIPREPCFKLAALRGTNAVVKAMLDNGHCGFYLAVAQEGEVGAGEAVRFGSRDESGVSIAQLAKLLTDAPVPKDVLERAVSLETITPYWREKIVHRLGPE